MSKILAKNKHVFKATNILISETKMRNQNMDITQMIFFLNGVSTASITAFNLLPKMTTENEAKLSMV